MSIIVQIVQIKGKTHIKHGYTSMVHVARGAIWNQGVQISKAVAQFIINPAPGGRVVESEDFLGFRLLTPTPAVLKNLLRLQQV